MKLRKLKIFFLLFSIFILTALALPEFSLNVFHKEIIYPGIGFGKIGIGTDYGSFVKGKDIFSSQKYYVEVNFEEGLTDSQKSEKLNQIRTRFAKRLDYTNLYDIDMDSEIKDSKYFITIFVPQNHENPKQYVEWITAQGIFSFHSGFSTDESSQIDLNDFDIQGQISLDTVVSGNRSFRTLIFNVKEEKAAVISPILNSNESQGITLAIDNTPAFVIQPAAAANQQNFSLTFLRAIPLNSLENSSESDYLNFVRYYFTEKEPLEYSLSVQDTSETIPPVYNEDGASIIAYTFVISIAFTILYILQTFGSKKALISTISYLIFYLILIDLLKFGHANLSYGTIIGLVTSLAISPIFIIDFIKSNKKEYKELLKKYSYISFIIFLSLIVVYKFQFNIGMINDFIGVILLMLLTIIIVSFSYFKIIKELSTNEQI